MRLVRSLTVTVSSLALAAAVGTTPSFFLHDSPSQGVTNEIVPVAVDHPQQAAASSAVVNFGAPRTVTAAVVNFGAPQSLLIF
jgi:hypothetical protein